MWFDMTAMFRAAARYTSMKKRGLGSAFAFFALTLLVAAVNARNVQAAQTEPQPALSATTQPGSPSNAWNPFDIPDDLRPFEMISPYGDWLGLRSGLKQFGISPDLNLEIDTVANPVGGNREGITEASNLGFNTLADLDKIAGIKGGSFLLQLSERWGTSLSKEYIGNAFDTQQDFGGETFKLVDAAYQQKLFDEWSCESAESLQMTISRFANTTIFSCKTASMGIPWAFISTRQA
jgi:hypothetical protein